MKKLVLSNKEKLAPKQFIEKMYETFEYVLERYGSIFIFNEGVAYRVKMFDLIGLSYSDEDIEIEGSCTYFIDETRYLAMQYGVVAKKIHSPKPNISIFEEEEEEEEEVVEVE